MVSCVRHGKQGHTTYELCRTYKVRKGRPFPFGGEGAVAAQDAEILVKPLFNENDSCGEAVLRQNARVAYTLPDGREGIFWFIMGENIILGHEDIA